MKFPFFTSSALEITNMSHTSAFPVYVLRIELWSLGLYDKHFKLLYWLSHLLSFPESHTWDFTGLNLVYPVPFLCWIHSSVFGQVSVHMPHPWTNLPYCSYWRYLLPSEYSHIILFSWRMKHNLKLRCLSYLWVGLCCVSWTCELDV